MAQAPPSLIAPFSKQFIPATIGPGSVSTLQFEINNPDGVNPVTDLAFMDMLPAGVVIATPANASSTCGGTLSAPDGGGTITFSDGSLAAGGTCFILVDVTSAVAGMHTNTSGDLTSSLGNLGNAVANLTVDATRPGFSKSFSPDMISLGQRSTLTFTIDNTANASAAANLTFSDSLPSGVEVAGPANASSTCTGGEITAVPGSSLIAYGPLFGGDASVAAMSSCAIMVDVIGRATGLHVNVSGELTSFVGFGPANSSGKATDAIQVMASLIALRKSFTDDPAPPGGTVTLEFIINNLDRDLAATNITFSDDLDAALSGLTATGLPANDVCGTGSLLSGTSTVTLTGGNLPAQGSCTFSVILQVPAGAVPGAYTNTTSSIMADLGGSPVVGDPATELLFVETVPLLTKEFIGDPVGAGGSVIMRFTITNTSTASTATDIAFMDELTTFFPFPISVTLPAMPCGAGSSISLISLGLDRQALSLIDGSLDPAPGAGSTCTFDVTLDVPVGIPTGTYVNTTSEITATVSGSTVVGNPATDSFDVVAAPTLDKEFTDDPVLPGATVTLEFTLTHDANAPGDASGISFTDDLTTVFAGLTASGLPLSDLCGPGNGTLTGSAGDTLLTFSGATLTPGQVCVFSVTLNVPGSAPAGSHTNTTSDVTAQVLGVATAENPASDDLTIASLTLSKEFTNDPVIAGGTVDLKFTIENVSPSEDATDIFFDDDLDSALENLAVDPASVPVDPCGTGSLITLLNSNTFIRLSGGSLLAGEMCMFTLTLNVPAGAASDTYQNTTSAFQAIIDDSTVLLDNASDDLVVDSELLLLSKEFTDDPTVPGGTVTLEFTITNLDPDDAATAITFTDDLDAALSGLAAIGLPVMDVCGAGSQISGAGVLTLTGGNIPAGLFCTFSVTLQVPAAAAASSATNTTSQVSGTISGLPVTGPAASDTLLINQLSFSKAFLSASVPSGMVTLRFTIQNLSATNAVTGIGFSDDLNAVIAGLAALGLPQANVCGAGSQIAGTTFVTLTGGNLPASGSCMIDVTLQVPASAAPGSFGNTTSNLFVSGLPTASPATASLIIEPPPLFSKAFSPNPIAVGGTSRLTFSIDNSASSLNASGLNFNDNLPAGLLVASPPNASTTCSGGTITAVAATSVISYSGGTVLAGASCTLEVDVSGSAAGTHLNTSGDLTSSSGNSGTASDSLVVNPPPLFSKSFSPSAIAAGGISTLTFSIDNTASSAAADNLDFTDNLPAAVQVASPANASTDCTGGTLTAASASSVISYSGGSVAAASSCTISVDVTSSTVGAHVNTSGDLTSSLGNSGTASDTLTVDPPPVFSKAFSPNPIAVNGISILTFTIDNSASSSDATSLDFSDDLPASVVVSTPANASTTCTGGTLTAASGSSQISYSGGTVLAASSCTILVDVTSDTAGMHLNTTSDLTSSLGTSPAASDTLTVIDSAILMTKSFNGAVLPGGFVEVEYTINNTSASLPLTNIAFSNDFSAVIAGLAAVGLPTSDVCGAGSQITGTSVLSLSGGSLAAGASCTFSVTLEVPGDAAPGDYPCITSDVTADAPGGPISGPPAAATLTIIFFDFSKAFGGNISSGSTASLSFTISNPDLLNGASDITFSDDLNAVLPGLEAVGLPQSGVCGAGSQIDGTSLITLTGGILGPGESCSFSVAIHIPAGAPAGDFTNVTSPLEATVGNSTVVGDPATAAAAMLNIGLLAIPLMNGWGLAMLGSLIALVACWRLLR